MAVEFYRSSLGKGVVNLLDRLLNYTKSIERMFSVPKKFNQEILLRQYQIVKWNGKEVVVVEDFYGSKKQVLIQNHRGVQMYVPYTSIKTRNDQKSLEDYTDEELEKEMNKRKVKQRVEKTAQELLDNSHQVDSISMEQNGPCRKITFIIGKELEYYNESERY